jgi:hypothetical protein
MASSYSTELVLYCCLSVLDYTVNLTNQMARLGLCLGHTLLHWAGWQDRGK